MSKKLTHLSLFTGIGGIDLAAEAAGFETVAQCENADYPIKVLEKHWKNVPRFRDIRDLTKEEFINATGQEKVTLISGGFPCQPFSAAGTRKGFSDVRYLWPEMARVIGELHPTWVLGENVAGFINVGLDKTIFDLEREGYNVQSFVYPACGVGAWHQRERTFIIGYDVSNTSCIRQHQQHKRCSPSECVFVRAGISTEEKPQRKCMESSTVGGGILSNPDSIRRISVNTETGNNATVEGRSQPCIADNQAGTSGERQGSNQSRLGGMADGIPKGMDGHLIWKEEPKDIPRVTEYTKNRAHRLKVLGNAVCPQQVFPILKYIADIETGVCVNNCVLCNAECLEK